MKFYVIYSFDCPKSVSVNYFKPPQIKKWKLTEGDDQYELSHLGGDWNHGKHRKYVRLIESKKEFYRFVEDTGLIAQSVETMGSITEFGLLPAISFISEDLDADGYANAYVTPIPENHEGKELEGNDKHWKWIKQAILNFYGPRFQYASQTYRNHLHNVTRKGN
jgi:hypothetical protein